MELSENEFLSLYGQLSDRDVKISALIEQNKRLESELTKSREECGVWKKRVQDMEIRQTKVDLENTMLRNYLLLSWSKIKQFVAHVRDIRLVSFLQTFMQKTVSDELQPLVLETINQVVELPSLESMPAIMNNNYNAPILQQVTHADKVSNGYMEERRYE